ncbi:MAG: peptide chain release factor 1 [Candidatus Latescibacteria bacterium]|nr:peptide chain release factor 1 [Candidatus Latescibacterota bacterium]
MLERIDNIDSRYAELTDRLSDPAVISDQQTFQRLSKEHSDLAPIVAASAKYREAEEGLAEAEEIIVAGEDPELVELAEMEKEELQERCEALEAGLRLLLVPKDPNDDKGLILEIRAGTGGDEAGIFAGDLLRMYMNHAESQGWKIEPISSSSAQAGGFKEVVVGVSGTGAYGRLKYESGVHRVQRVPATEASGRIHTSAASVAVLPEADEVEVEIVEHELRIDLFRSSGPGGQSVNTTDSAVRITHLPTGLVVSCQDEKSQHKNKAKALKVLRSRLLDKAIQDQQDKTAADRREQVGTGDRSEKIRTYNFPQSRLTDHRIKFTIHNLSEVLDGNLDDVVDALKEADLANRLQVDGQAE